MFVKMRALIIKIVGADDRGITTGIAAAKPAFFNYRHIGDAVFLGQIIGCTEAMTASFTANAPVLSAGDCIEVSRTLPLSCAWAVKSAAIVSLLANVAEANSAAKTVSPPSRPRGQDSPASEAELD